MLIIFNFTHRNWLTRRFSDVTCIQAAGENSPRRNNNDIYLANDFIGNELPIIIDIYILRAIFRLPFPFCHCTPILLLYYITRCYYSYNTCGGRSVRIYPAARMTPFIINLETGILCTKNVAKWSKYAPICTNN